MREPREITCPLCKGQARYVYTMNSFGIFQCTTCGTGQASPAPDEATLLKLYEGFMPNLSLNNLTRLLDSAYRMFRECGLPQGQNLKMLDIGGGGGYCCKAFELLDYGESTYVDLDSFSCEFARNKLKLDRVYNCDALELSKHVDVKFDFIHCRHLIEHLLNPAGFLLKTMDLLSENGIFLMTCPNGESIEYLAYPTDKRMKNRIAVIRAGNSWTALKTWLALYFGKMNHGMDPPRHLWAITAKGVQMLMEKNGYRCRTFTRTIADQAYSVFYKHDKRLVKKLQYFVARKIFVQRHGGCHLIAIMQHPASTTGQRSHNPS